MAGDCDTPAAHLQPRPLGTGGGGHVRASEAPPGQPTVASSSRERRHQIKGAVVWSSGADLQTSSRNIPMALPSGTGRGDHQDAREGTGAPVGARSRRSARGTLMKSLRQTAARRGSAPVIAGPPHLPGRAGAGRRAAPLGAVWVRGTQSPATTTTDLPCPGGDDPL